MRGALPARPAYPASDQVRAGDQHHDRKGARHYRAAGALARVDEVIK